MKKWLWMGLIAALPALPCASQQNRNYGKNDPAAKNILDAVSNSLKAYHSVSADFIFKIQGPDQKLEGSKTGNLLVQGSRYRIMMNGQEMYCDGKTTWTYSRDGNEVQVNNYEPEKGTITPSTLFTNFYDKEFLYRLSGQTTYQGKKLDEIEMTPLDKSKPFFKVNVDVDSKAHLIAKAEIFDKSGNRYTYQITRFRPNVPVTDSTFTFHSASHPHVEVVDLR
jgi:outer membrane lipoprotein carrier protein